eukprot:CAMPEP_0117009984 /NCGR_PEP_ID=MMETSP0472-20121206/8922_1 /TAXON_ID=693140 ORGANISM="Tiarina fusus, Strain LIS" /NCGR_SAMPLE_ID=MMETSP0472 /ASSEMBLY_ACC=CAM_ASM_000603 /LENGTH=185 /DNA_ID=CAMNT_0004712415 /DNA_START=132 /DNA_END=685 /DNA_ORIENTATION=-
MAPIDKDGDHIVSMSEHLFDQVSTWTDPKASIDEKVQKAKNLKPFIGEVDGYLSFDSESSSEGKWPVLEWTSHFRKAYNLLLWIRPVVTDKELQTTILEDTTPQRRVLYRLATSPEDHSGVGVCVTVGDWRMVVSENSRKVTTTLTAYSLPFSSMNPLQDNPNSEPFSAPSFVTAQLELPENEWS